MYRVMIVEDDPMVAMINAQYVKRNPKFEVVADCRDGANALEFLRKEAVDLLILDVFMPLMDGVELLHKIREEKIPVEVIMVTAANDAATLEETIHLGVIDYLVKPFDFGRFQIALEKYAAQTNALKGVETLNQQRVDHIISAYQKPASQLMPKGIQESTAAVITDFVRRYGAQWLTGEEIALGVGLSGVTVRRYMNYLVKTGAVIGEMNYETGGRPSMLYRASE